jgi:general stress protein 26
MIKTKDSHPKSLMNFVANHTNYFVTMNFTIEVSNKRSLKDNLKNQV